VLRFTTGERGHANRHRSQRRGILRREVVRGGSANVRVLVVDRDDDVATVVKRTLRDADVVERVEPHEALDRLRHGESFDVIVCDLVQPGMTGELLFDEIMWVAPAQARRIIFTGGATDEKSRAFLAMVAQPFVRKPIDVDELGARVQSLLRSKD
jgi:CheY-like chemotaxis protein